MDIKRPDEYTMTENPDIDKKETYDLAIYFEEYKRIIILGIKGKEIETILKRFREVEKYTLFLNDPMQAKRNEYLDNSMRHGQFLARYEYPTHKKLI